jgi:transcriptional regulator with XRE-family HTH domain
MSNAPLSPSQKADARRLQELFKQKKQELGLTQETLAYEMGFSGQTVVSQYLTGRIPLNIRVAVGFARHLRVAVADFSESLQREIDELAAYASGKPLAATAAKDNWPFSVPLVLYDRLSESDKLRLNVMVESFVRSFVDKEKPRKKSTRAA